ncbi:MAG: YfhO family protein, partial [Clostridia bacterium]|nr:YfhO family protein [Clostridia bacterium]
GNVSYMVPLVLGAKIICISLSATFFIKKLFPKIPPVTVAVLAFLYTFSGYFHVANTYINWLDFMIYLPIATLGFIRFIKTGKYLLFSVMLAAMIYACFSIACFSMLIVFLILFTYSLLCGEKGKRRETITKICLCLVLTVALALPVIIPALLAYLKSGRNTGLFSEINDALDFDHLYSKLSYVFIDAVFFVSGVFYFITCDKKDKKNLFLFLASLLVLAPVLVDEICLILNAGSYMSYSLRFGFLNSMLGLYITCLLAEKVKKDESVKTYKWPVSCIIAAILLSACAGVIYLIEDVIDSGKDAFLFTLPLFKEGTPVYDFFKEAEFGKSFSSMFAHSLGGLEIISIVFGVFGLSLATIFLLKKFKIFPYYVAMVAVIAISFLQGGFAAYHTVAGDDNTFITYDRINGELVRIFEKDPDITQYRIKDYNNKVTADAPLTLHYRSYSVFSSVIDHANFEPADFFKYTGNGVNTIKTKGGNIFSDSLLGFKYAFYDNKIVTSKNWTAFDGGAHPDGDMPEKLRGSWADTSGNSIIVYSDKVTVNGKINPVRSAGEDFIWFDEDEQNGLIFSEKGDYLYIVDGEEQALERTFYLYENTTVFPTAFRIPGGEYDVDEGNYGDKMNSLYAYLGGESELVYSFRPTTVRYKEEEGFWLIGFQPALKIAGNSYVIADLPEGVKLKYSLGNKYDEEGAKYVDESFFYNCGYNSGTAYYTVSVVSDDEISEDVLKDCFTMQTVSLDRTKKLSEKAHEKAADVKFGGNEITATVTAEDGEYLFVNYVAIKGYKCFVNGRKAELVDNDLNFLVVRLEAGENKVEFRYSSPYVKYMLVGALIGGVLAFAVIMAMKYYERISKALEWIADVGADLLAAGIFGFGFVY